MRKPSLNQFLFPLVSAALSVLFLVSCGATNSTSTGAPTVVDNGGGTGNGTGNPDPLPTGGTTPTPGLPDLTGSVTFFHAIANHNIDLIS